ncbi:hypothetical protein HBP99_13725 [Listeria booriae]|uniref:hypothetical protein n=1 Tax=Listeria booriae TaxID=1552123 RepID=UPI00162AE1C4|nr:hypothetical protein [Listeria booriae]MBC2259694.1 hypothetical protein [Listeria booriae]MBC2369701.1 hypothetical protein [Listeria booriae]
MKKMLAALSIILFTSLFIGIPSSKAENSELKSIKVKESQEIKFKDLDKESQKIFKAQGFSEEDTFYESVNIDSN